MSDNAKLHVTARPLGRGSPVHNLYLVDCFATLAKMKILNSEFLIPFYLPVSRIFPST